MRFFTPFLPAILVLSIAATPTWAGEFHTRWRSVSFETPTALSPPREIGLDAVTVTDPPDATHGKAAAEIILVAIPDGMRQDLGNSDSEILSYVKSTFLGTSGQADKAVKRAFLGRMLVGELLTPKIPEPREVEVYLVPLAGESVAVAFCRGVSITRQQFDALIEMAARTLRESRQK